MPNPFPPLPTPEEGGTPKWQSPDWFGNTGAPVNPSESEPPAKPARPARPAPAPALPRAAEPAPAPAHDAEPHEPRQPNLDPRTMPRMAGIEGFQSQVTDANLWPGQSPPPAPEPEPAVEIPPGFVEDPVFGIVPAPEASASARAARKPEPVKVAAPREAPRPEPRPEPVEAPEFLQDRPIVPRAANAAAVMSAPAGDPWWRPYLAPWPLGVAGMIVVVVVLVFSLSRKPGSGEVTVSISHIRTHAAAFDGRAVRVRGRVGDVFQVGGGYAFYLIQGRDTMVVFTRSRIPQTNEKLIVNGVISTGMLNGQVRQALLEGAP